MQHRLAIEKDFDEIYDLYMDRDANPYLTYDLMEKKFFWNIYMELLSTSTLFVVIIDSMMVASYRLIPKNNRQAHIYYLGSFVTNKNLKGQGIGTSVLKYIKEYSFITGRIRIELTVDLHNQPAIHLYKKMGFNIEGIVKKSYRLNDSGEYYDEYLMACILS